jgi:hypothetical protein
LKTNLLLSFSLLFIISLNTSGQTITGAWKGKIKNIRAELKIIRLGDSLVGTSYYYESKNNFRRYRIKGFFDPFTNQVIWWDDMLMTDKASGIFARTMAPEALLSTADFNCPGEDEMLLDGSSSLRDNKEIDKGAVHLEKTSLPIFTDEWDFVIENYTVGANDPYVIDSISNLGYTLSTPDAVQLPTSKTVSVPQVSTVTTREVKKLTKPVSLEDKFVTRKKTLATVIPLTADSVELRFYDNAEIDGDSIALFMNNNLVFKNIRLSDQPYTIKFATSSLERDNELVMVAENLGSIPPNTSLMVAIVGDKRYEARLQSTENSSALIRFLKQGSTP